MALWISSAVLFAIAFFLINPNPGDKGQNVSTIKRDKASPVWHINLHPQIGSTPLGIVGGIGRETLGRPRTSLWFLDDDTIVVTYVTREPVSELSERRKNAATLPLHLRAIFVNASDGSIKNVKLWPIESRYTGVVAVHDGALVLQAGNRVWQYSPNSGQTRTVELPEGEPDDWDARPSPTGRSILFVATDLRTTQPVQWVWLDTEQLRIKRSWKEIQSGWVGISDDKIAMTACFWIKCMQQVQTRTLDSAWETVAPAGPKNEPRPKFVNDDTLVLLSDPTLILDDAGQVLLQQAIRSRPQGCWWGEPFPAANGLRFAVPSCKLTGAFPALDLGGADVLKRIVLYDSPFHQISHIIELKGPKVKDLADMAMSPDGLKLAILKNESLEVVNLPPLSR